MGYYILRGDGYDKLIDTYKLYVINGKLYKTWGILITTGIVDPVLAECMNGKFIINKPYDKKVFKSVHTGWFSCRMELLTDYELFTYNYKTSAWESNKIKDN